MCFTWKRQGKHNKDFAGRDVVVWDADTKERWILPLNFLAEIQDPLPFSGEHFVPDFLPPITDTIFPSFGIAYPEAMNTL